MEPITATAIVAALAAGVAASAGKIGENVLLDSYAALKELLKRRFGSDSRVVKAVDDLEAKPDSEGRKRTLREEVDEAGADEDPQIRDVAQQLVAHIEAQPGGDKHLQQAIGNYIAQADRQSSAQVNVDRNRETN